MSNVAWEGYTVHGVWYGATEPARGVFARLWILRWGGQAYLGRRLPHHTDTTKGTAT